MLEFEKIVESFENGVDWVIEEEESTWWIPLETDKFGNDWAIVIGWTDGFDEVESDKFAHLTYRVCAKVAYCTNKSVMHEYNYDWMMPIMEDDFVYDTEIEVRDYSFIEEHVRYFLSNFETMKRIGLFKDT